MTPNLQPAARKTKILATLGPASREPEVIERLIRAGANGFRLNFSHGTQAEHAETIARVREISARLGAQVAILGDLPGPKLRLEELDDGGVELQAEKEQREQEGRSHGPSLNRRARFGYACVAAPGPGARRGIASSRAGLRRANSDHARAGVGSARATIQTVSAAGGYEIDPYEQMAVPRAAIELPVRVPTPAGFVP